MTSASKTKTRAVAQVMIFASLPVALVLRQKLFPLRQRLVVTIIFFFTKRKTKKVADYKPIHGANIVCN